MAIERWDPFRETISLRDAMNSLLQESFVRPGGMGPASQPRSRSTSPRMRMSSWSRRRCRA
jgi:hypothetical protein